MDDEPRIDDEIHSPQTKDEKHDEFTGAFFSHAQHFVVAGGNFTNITQIAPELPSDFRRFPMGDLNLRNEIWVVKSGEVYRRYGRRSARRVYSARIHGSASDMTVAMYQGDNAEEEWREDIAQYSRLRHPSIVHLFGMASACGMHAVIFNEELIPVRQMLEKYSGSHLQMVHLWRFLNTDFDQASEYSQSVLGYSLHSMDCTLWIRPSTGRLCVDPTADEYSGLNLGSLLWDTAPSFTLSVLEPPEDPEIVGSLSLDHYHEICDLYFGHPCQLSISTNTSVQLGAVISVPPGSDITHSNEIACIPNLDITDCGWYVSTGASLPVLENGWTRVDSSEASNGCIHRRIWATYRALQDRAWLVQASHVFHCLGITSNHDDYVVIRWIRYQLNISESGNSIPPGYLFLCPLADLQLDIPSRFRLPDCPAYWSLDPSGANRLSTEEADQLRFPIFNMEMKATGWSWDESVYTGIRQFHEAKGFHPDGQNVARELGYKLYKISTELDVQTIDVCDDRTETQETADGSEQPVHAESDLITSPIQKGLPRANDVETSGPSNYWKIIIGVQFAVILTLGALWWYDRFHY